MQIYHHYSFAKDNANLLLVSIIEICFHYYGIKAGMNQNRFSQF